MPRVRTYRNLHNGSITVQCKYDGRWLVVGHCDQIRLNNTEFKVYQSGRQKVLDQQQKNVHAYVIGDVMQLWNFRSYKGRNSAYWEQANCVRPVLAEMKYCKTHVAYNPYKWSQFVHIGDCGTALYPMGSQPHSRTITVNCNGRIFIGGRSLKSKAGEGKYLERALKYREFGFIPYIK